MKNPGPHLSGTCHLRPPSKKLATDGRWPVCSVNVAPQML
jgi:hypothetical protein